MKPFHAGPVRALAIGTLALAGVASFGAVRNRVAAQPPASAAATAGSDSAARGKAVYEKRCVECHGAAGRGDGPASLLLAPRPRDFTAGKFKIRSTESGSPPTDDDLLRSVRQGLYGTAMPGWEKVLSEPDIQDVVVYIKTLSPRFTSELAASVTLGAQVPSSPDSILRGLQVYGTLKCTSCHGRDGRGAGAIATDFKDDWNQPLKASDLTEPWTFHGGSTARDIYLRFRTGMSGTPMPSFKDTATDAEMWDLANYVVSLGRKPVWSMRADEITALYAQQAREAKENPVQRGRYLVEADLCALCHSPIDRNGRILPGMTLAGGQLMRVVPFGDFPTGNLTSDKDTGLGNWTDDQIKNAITRGVLPNGARLPPFPMDWSAFSALTPDDLNAVVAYLRTVPAVSNKVPGITRPVLPAYLWGKFKMLILQIDPPIIIYPGNVGSAGRRS
jgi:cytochrome c oxidase cbb3-type subunit 2